jgi:hypothetical protein
MFAQLRLSILSDITEGCFIRLYQVLCIELSRNIKILSLYWVYSKLNRKAYSLGPIILIVCNSHHSSATDISFTKLELLLVRLLWLLLYHLHKSCLFLCCANRNTYPLEQRKLVFTAFILMKEISSLSIFSIFPFFPDLKLKISYHSINLLVKLHWVLTQLTK